MRRSEEAAGAGGAGSPPGRAGFPSGRPREAGRTLELLPSRLSMCRLGQEEPFPAWAIRGDILSITRTLEELSVVCAEECVPPKTRREGPFRALRVAEVLDSSEVGILASLSSALAAAGVSLLAVSTFDTDYLLVREEDLGAASRALGAAGHELRDAPTTGHRLWRGSRPR